MERRHFVRAVAGASLVAGGASCNSADPDGAVASSVDGPRVDWRLATSFTPVADVLHGAGVRIGEVVSALTGGRFRIRTYAAGELVPGNAVMDAVMSGTIQCGVSPGYYYTGKHPALAFDTAIPFGLTTRQHYAWLHHGGGLELINAIYADFGIVSFPTSTTGGQMGGWFREPIGSVDDLRGLRFRIPGIGGEVMTRLGVTVQNLMQTEIFPAMERGAIDATEWVGPYDDKRLGLHQVAKNYYAPGWWEPGVSQSLLVSASDFNELPPSYQAALRTACESTFADRLSTYDSLNPVALARLVSEHGVILHQYPEDVMDAAWVASNDYLREQAAADPTFRQILDSYDAFRRAQWRYASGNELVYRSSAFPRTI